MTTQHDGHIFFWQTWTINREFEGGVMVGDQLTIYQSKACETDNLAPRAGKKVIVDGKKLTRIVIFVTKGGGVSTTVKLANIVLIPNLMDNTVCGGFDHFQPKWHCQMLFL